MLILTDRILLFVMTNHVKPPQSRDSEHYQPTLFEVMDASDRLELEKDYKILDSPELRADYVSYTERLIANIINEEADDVVFLDKSARPVAWMVRSLWPMLGIDDNGRPVEEPKMYFANIDREQWGHIMGRSEDRQGGIDASKVPAEIIDDLRATYTSRTLKDGESADKEKTLFDNRKLMIVDEVKSSGDTLVMADRLFSRAFPEAETTTTYWMPPVVKTLRTGIKVNADLPVWYDDYEMTGRLVGDRSIKASEQSTSRRQRRGALFLSTRFPKPDKRGLRLKAEIEQLAYDVNRGVIPVTPSGLRSVEAIDVIMQDVNQLSTEEFIALKRSSETSKTPFWKLVFDYKVARSRARHPAGKHR